MPGKLFLVATPIGNLGDLSPRAVETLQRAGFIACEDTRHSRVLLQHYRIGTPTVSLPGFAEKERAGGILDRVSSGEDCALITDAGSPGISDPGQVMVAEAIKRGIAVVPIPGPSAAIAALSASGLPTARFCFLGFLPRKAGDRKALLDEVAPLSGTLVIYESPQRLGQTLADLLSALGDRSACVARELTKVHEEWARGTLSSLQERYRNQEPRGEVVVLVEGRAAATRWDEEEVKAALKDRLASGDSLKAASAEVARQAGWQAQAVYRLGLGLKARS
jgi:16S rRNA (cytidine1402-2'-O)-methyltransferase